MSNKIIKGHTALGLKNERAKMLKNCNASHDKYHTIKEQTLDKYHGLHDSPILALFKIKKVHHEKNITPYRFFVQRLERRKLCA